MERQIPLDPDARAEDPRPDPDDRTHEVAHDLACKRLLIVNVAFYGRPRGGDGSWVLIDAGIMGSADAIQRAAAERFGGSPRPVAIVLTHGHFDHVGALAQLAERWDVPIHAHEPEHPYLTGQASYPPPDPSVGGGLMSAISIFYPRGPIDVRQWLRPLPADGAVPGMPGWRWLATPGHTPGHVALWRESDRSLIAGDAFITTRQESAYAVALQRDEMRGPPMYYTQDWLAARESVGRLARLEPELAVSGHGRPMRGPAMRAALHALARDFDRVAVPEHGRYVDDPTRPSLGNAYPPPREP